VTSGATGYVGVATGTGATVEEANAQALRVARGVVVPNLRYRRDIGERVARSDLARLQSLGWYDSAVSCACTCSRRWRRSVRTGHRGSARWPVRDRLVTLVHPTKDSTPPMYIGRQEWQQLEAGDPSPAPLQTVASASLKDLYHRLADGTPDAATREEAAAFLRREIAAQAAEPADLPASPDGLLAWMDNATQAVHARYADYLAERQAGAPRRYFGNRAHALYVLRSIAPTKLVDGSWLQGLLPHWRNPRLAPLVRTYVEELGEGAVDKNHVVLYRGLLARYALDPLDDLDDALYRQGVLQLALGWNAQDFLPEIAGFNLGYEQLPLHLLITAYELNELGLDPYYFTLHVTVDNADTGHARRACQAVLDLLPRVDDGGAFWRRVQAGSKLASAGPGTDGGHRRASTPSARCCASCAQGGQGQRLAFGLLPGGRAHVNDWLSDPAPDAGVPAALLQAGWIRRGEPAANSRFWKLLQGERAEMFGVFSSYELQVIHDWIRGDASRDGLPHDAGEGERRRPTFRAAARNGMVASLAADASTLLDPDLDAFTERLRAQPSPTTARRCWWMPCHRRRTGRRPAWKRRACSGAG
jgi:hypothetical protein